MADIHYDFANGNDANPGTLASPKKTLPAVINTGAANDRHLLAVNQTFTGGTQIQVAGITLGAYEPSGVTFTSRPVVTNTTRPNGGKYYGSEVLRDGFTFQDVDIDDCLNGGLIVYQANNDFTLQDFEIRNCGFGVVQKGDNFTIRRGTIRDGVMVVNTVGGVDDVGCLGVALETGGTPKVPITSGLIQDVDFINLIGPSFDFTRDGGAIETFGTVYGVKVVRCTMDTTKGILESGGRSGDSDTVAIKFAYCTFLDHYGIWVYTNDPVGSFPVAIDTANGGIVFENCSGYDGTVYPGGVDPKSPFWKAGDVINANEFTIRNCSIQTRANLGNLDPAVITHEYNVIDRSDGTAMTWSQPNGGGGYNQIAWTAGTGEVVNSDPVYTDAANNDFTPDTGSPLIEAGTASTSEAYTTDVNGDPIQFYSSNTVVDIGAISIQAASAPVEEIQPVKVGAPFQPQNTAAGHVTEGKYVKGSIAVVADTTERDALATAGRFAVGSRVYVQSASALYRVAQITPSFTYDEIVLDVVTAVQAGIIQVGSNLESDDGPVFDARLCLGAPDHANVVPDGNFDTWSLMPLRSGKVALWDTTNSRFETHVLDPASTLTGSFPASTFTNYDVFLYDNSGTLALEFIAYSDDETPAAAAALSYANDVALKSSDLSRRYIGIVRTHSSSGFVRFANGNRTYFLMNAYNRIPYAMSAYLGISQTWGASTAGSWLELGGNQNQRLDTIYDRTASHPIRLNFNCQFTGQSAVSVAGIGVNVNNANSAITRAWSDGSTIWQSDCFYEQSLAVGRTTFQPIVKISTATTTIGSANADLRYGIRGTNLC